MKIEEIEGSLEMSNFLVWCQSATTEDIAIAKKNNLAKLKELVNKYRYHLDFIFTAFCRDEIRKEVMSLCR